MFVHSLENNSILFLSPPLQDSKLTQWAHETLLQILDADLLPIYLDILQVLKAKVGTEIM